MPIQQYLEIVKEHLHEPIHSVKVDDRGWDHYVLLINKQWIFRFPRRQEAAEKYKREKLVLDRLNLQLTGIQVPEYHFINQNGQTSPICVYYKLIPGVPLANLEKLRQDKRQKTAKDIGHFLSILHGTKMDRIKEFGFGRRRTKDFWESIRKNLRQKVFPFLTDDETTEIERTFDVLFQQVLQKDIEETILHGDFSSDHILYDGKKECVNGVIDFGDAMIGDPAYDIGGLYWCYGSDFVKEVLQYYQLDFDKEQLYDRASSFYGKQAVFHNMIHAVEQEDQKLWQKALKIFRTKLSRT